MLLGAFARETFNPVLWQDLTISANLCAWPCGNAHSLLPRQGHRQFVPVDMPSARRRLKLVSSDLRISSWQWHPSNQRATIPCCPSALSNGCEDGRTDGRSVGRRADGRSDGRTVGRTDGRTDGRTVGRSGGRTGHHRGGYHHFYHHLFIKNHEKSLYRLLGMISIFLAV